MKQMNSSTWKRPLRQRQRDATLTHHTSSPTCKADLMLEAGTIWPRLARYRLAKLQVEMEDTASRADASSWHPRRRKISNFLSHPDLNSIDQASLLRCGKKISRHHGVRTSIVRFELWRGTSEVQIVGFRGWLALPAAMVPRSLSPAASISAVFHDNAARDLLANAQVRLVSLQGKPSVRA